MRCFLYGSVDKRRIAASIEKIARPSAVAQAVVYVETNCGIMERIF
jgi:hypothetical protein